MFLIMITILLHNYCTTVRNNNELSLHVNEARGCKKKNEIKSNE